MPVGDVRLIAYEKVDKTWELLSGAFDLISLDYGWRSSEAAIDIGMDAKITGSNITIQTTAWTSKTLDASKDPEYSFPTRSVVLVDVDGDSDLDLIVGNYDKPNRLYLNDGTGKFEEVGALIGSAYNFLGDENASMGVDCADYNHDGRLDFYQANADQPRRPTIDRHQHDRLPLTPQLVGIFRQWPGLDPKLLQQLAIAQRHRPAIHLSSDPSTGE